MLRLSLSVGLILTLALVGCGGGDESGLPSLGPGGGETAPAAENFTGTIMGKISFEGTPPANRTVKMGDADPKCPTSGMTDEFTVNDGGLGDVIVYVSGGGVEGKKFAVPSQPVTIDQNGCHYIPHALTIQVNQTLLIKNSDPTAHNIRANAEKGATFNISEQPGVPPVEQKFTAAEMPLRINCDVHKWMQSWVGVFTHPFHAVSKKDGQYEFKVPAGKYEVTAWHEKYQDKTQTQTVEVAEGGMGHVNFTFKAAEASK